MNFIKKERFSLLAGRSLESNNGGVETSNEENFNKLRQYIVDKSNSSLKDTEEASAIYKKLSNTKKIELATLAKTSEQIDLLNTIKGNLNELKSSIDTNKTSFDSLLKKPLEKKGEYFLSNFVAGRYYSDGNLAVLQEKEDLVYIKDNGNRTIDLLVDDTGFINGNITGVPMNTELIQAIIDLSYIKIEDVWFFGSQEFKYSYSQVEKLFNKKVDDIIELSRNGNYTLAGKYIGALPLFWRNKLEPRKNQIIGYEEIAKKLGGYEEINTSTSETIEAINTTIENPIPKIITETANIKIFLGEAITSIDAYNNKIDLNNIKGLVYWAVQNKSNYDGEEVGVFLEEVRKLTNSYEKGAYRNEKLDKEFLEIKSPFKSLALNNALQVVETVDKLKKKTYEELINNLTKINIKVEKQDKEAINKKREVLGAIKQKMLNENLYLKKDNNNDFKIASTKGLKITESQEVINNINQQDLQTILIFLSATKNETLLRNDSYKENIPSNIFNSVLTEYNFKNENNNGKPFTLLDFESSEETREGKLSYLSKEQKENNIKSIIPKIDAKIQKLIEKNKSPQATEQNILDNFAKIQKLEIAKAFVQDNRIFSDEAMTFSRDTMDTGHGISTLTGVSAKDIKGAREMLDSIQKGAITDFAFSTLSKGIGLLVINWMFDWFKGSSPELVKWLKRGAIGVFGFSVVTDIANRAGKNFSDFLPGKANANGVSLGTVPDTREIKSDLGIVPKGIEGIFETSYKRVYAENKKEKRLDITALQKIFLVASNDPVFWGKNLNDIPSKTPSDIEGFFSTTSISILRGSSISNNDLLMFSTLLYNTREQNDISILDAFSEGMYKNTQVEANTYFYGEKKFNSEIAELLRSLPGIPENDLFGTQGVQLDEVKNSTKNKVSKALKLDWNIGGRSESTIKDIVNLNDFIENNKISNIETVITNLTSLKNSITNTSEQTTIDEIITKYTSLKSKYSTLGKVEEFSMKSGYGYFASLVGLTGVWGWAKKTTENTLGGGKNEGTNLSKQEISKYITEGETLLETITNSTLEEGDKTKAREVVEESIKELMITQEYNLLEVGTDEEIKVLYEKQIKKDPEKVKNDVQEIVNELKTASTPSNDSSFYTNKLGKFSFFSKIKIEDIKKLTIISKLAETSGNKAIIELAEKGLASFEAFKANLKAFGRTEKEKITTQESGILKEIKNATTTEQINIIVQKVDRLRDNIFVGDNILTANIIYGVDAVVEKLGYGDGKETKYYNFFKIMETRIKKIDSNFSITNYPTAEDFRGIYEKLNTKKIDYFSSLGNKPQLTKDYIEKLKKAGEDISKRESGSTNVDGVHNIDLSNVKGELKDKIKEFTDELKKEILNAGSPTKIKELGKIYEYFNLKVGPIWDTLRGDSFGIKEVLVQSSISMFILSNRTKNIGSLEEGEVKDSCFKLINYIEYLKSNESSKSTGIALSKYFTGNKPLGVLIDNLKNINAFGGIPSANIELNNEQKNTLKDLEKETKNGITTYRFGTPDWLGNFDFGKIEL